MTYPALQSALEEEDVVFDSNMEFKPQRTSSPHNFYLLSPIKQKPPSSTESKKRLQSKNEVIGEMDSDRKPPGLSYIALISMAIQSSNSQKMLLSEIYQWISNKYPYYQMKEKSWRNSIRHNLSLNECFVKSGRSENGKGNYWSIHPANIEDFARGDYRRRRARRRVRICDKDLQRLCSNEGVPKSTSPASKINTYDGYIPMASTVVPADFMTSIGPEVVKAQPDWYQSEYYHYKNYEFKPYQQSILHRDAICQYPGALQEPNTDYGLRNMDYFSYNSNPPFCSQSNQTSGSCAQPESRFNVNVSVNVCGNGSSSQQPSPSQQQIMPSHQQLDQQHHLQQQQQPQQVYSPHFQSTYTSHYSQMYGPIYQDHMASPVL